MSENGATYLGTLGNGIRVIEALEQGPLSLRDLAAAVGLAKQTTYRLVYTLGAEGWVCRNPKDDTYSLSPHLWALSVRSFQNNDLRGRFAERVRNLAEVYGESVHLAIYDRGQVVYIDKADGSHPIHSYTSLGGQAPAYCVATGKVLLAGQTDSEIARVIALGLVQHTPGTITDPDQLNAELDQVAVDGFALNSGEWREDVGGLAVPICSPLGDTSAGLGFSGPVERIMNRRDELIAALRQCVAEDDLGAGSTSGRRRP